MDKIFLDKILSIITLSFALLRLIVNTNSEMYIDPTEYWLN